MSRKRRKPPTMVLAVVCHIHPRASWPMLEAMRKISYYAPGTVFWQMRRARKDLAYWRRVNGVYGRYRLVRDHLGYARLVREPPHPESRGRPGELPMTIGCHATRCRTQVRFHQSKVFTMLDGLAAAHREDVHHYRRWQVTDQEFTRMLGAPERAHEYLAQRAIVASDD